jgi:hypothetical protein
MEQLRAERDRLQQQKLQQDKEQQKGVVKKEKKRKHFFDFSQGNLGSKEGSGMEEGEDYEFSDNEEENFFEMIPQKKIITEKKKGPFSSFSLGFQELRNKVSQFFGEIKDKMSLPSKEKIIGGFGALPSRPGRSGTNTNDSERHGNERNYSNSNSNDDSIRYNERREEGGKDNNLERSMREATEEDEGREKSNNEENKREKEISEEREREEIFPFSERREGPIPPRSRFSMPLSTSNDPLESDSYGDNGDGNCHSVDNRDASHSHPSGSVEALRANSSESEKLSLHTRRYTNDNSKGDQCMGQASPHPNARHASVEATSISDDYDTVPAAIPPVSPSTEKRKEKIEDTIDPPFPLSVPSLKFLSNADDVPNATNPIIQTDPVTVLTAAGAVSEPVVINVCSPYVNSNRLNDLILDNMRMHRCCLLTPMTEPLETQHPPFTPTGPRSLFPAHWEGSSSMDETYNEGEMRDQYRDILMGEGDDGRFKDMISAFSDRSEFPSSVGTLEGVIPVLQSIDNTTDSDNHADRNTHATSYLDDIHLANCNDVGNFF